MKILLVEDEPKTGEYLRQGLSEAGFVVDWTQDGAEGLRYRFAPLDVLAEKYAADGVPAVPADYEQEFPYLPASRLRALGLGRARAASRDYGIAPRTFDVAALAERM